jgi:hypothetical protein
MLRAESYLLFFVVFVVGSWLVNKTTFVIGGIKLKQGGKGARSNLFIYFNLCFIYFYIFQSV